MPHHDATEFPEPTYREAVEGWQRCQAENARLQEQVEELETELGLLNDGNAVWLRVNEKLIHERDGWEALAKVRGEALEHIFVTASERTVMFPADGHWLSVRDTAATAITMTPEEARAATKETS